MKKNILVAALFSGLASVAVADVSPKACSLVPCGTYEGSGAMFDVNGKLKGSHLEKTVIAALDDKTVIVDEYVYAKNQKYDQGYHVKAKFVFGEDGQYTAIVADGSEDDGTKFANGTCRDGICTFAFFPWKDSKSGLGVGNVNILRFEGNRLRRDMMVTDSIKNSGTGYQRSVLVRK